MFDLHGLGMRCLPLASFPVLNDLVPVILVAVLTHVLSSVQPVHGDWNSNLKLQYLDFKFNTFQH